ncbi:MAG: hypothetical protein KFH98_07585 [Gemmatimonadetes bacterium]|nr:hypothetical protein [Gemmatimonadota bacterium]
MRGSARRTLVLASVGLLAVLFLLVPRDLQGAKTWKECIDDSFAEYNECLMESTSWFNRALCDLNWELQVAVCTASAFGDIKNAYEDGSSENP